ERAVCTARSEASGYGVRDDRIVARPRREPEQRPRALTARREQPRVAQRGRMARDLGLALAKQLGQLAHTQLFLGREGEETRSHRVRQKTVQLPPRRWVEPSARGAAGR